VAGERKAEFGYSASEKRSKVKCQEKWWEGVRRIAVQEFVGGLSKTFGVVGG